MNGGQGPAFVEAIKICFNKYVDFQGRACRAEYWWWTLFAIIVSVVIEVLEGLGNSVSGTQIFSILGLASLALVLPGIAVSVRRLHDLGKSGWWFLIALIPLVGPIILIVWFAGRGAEGNNEYGANPLGA
jgi:uncharacterized membrane protein YhaH (DUF805 family)